MFNFLNKGAPGGARRSRRTRSTSAARILPQGYDYNALIRASADGAKSFDPRYGQPDFWQTGLQGQFSVKFIF